MTALEKINGIVNDFVWGVPLLTLILAVGLYFTVRLGFIQFRYFGAMLRQVFRRRDDPTLSGELSSFQAAMTSVSAIVGSGNIAGVSTALVCGGPGALFWMIVAALIGMATKFAEICLGMLWRRTMPDGSVQGGAMYYLADGLKQKWLGVLFSVLVISLFYVFLTALIMFNVEPHFDPHNGTETFGSFFDALYWATVTLTTVGYGDMIPVTDIGRFISMVSSLFGVAIIALPSGIITASYLDEIRGNKENKEENDENRKTADND